MTFIGELNLRSPDRDLRRWVIASPFGYDTGEGVIIVPAGFVSDGASIPRIFWNIEPAWGRAGRAAVIHDYLYHLRRERSTLAPSRRHADRVFRDALVTATVARRHAWVLWAFVRVFGRWADDPRP